MTFAILGLLLQASWLELGAIVQPVGFLRNPISRTLQTLWEAEQILLLS